MNSNKQLAINMVAQMLSFVVGIAISFFVTPYIVNNVGVDAYGFVGLANSFINYAGIVIIALNSMSGRFITIEIHRKKYEEANRYFTSVLIGNIIVAALLLAASLFMVLNLEKLIAIPARIVTDIKLLMGLLFISFILSIVGNVFSVATFAQNRLELASIRNMESSFLNAAVILLSFYLFEPSVWYVGLASLISGSYVVCTNVYYTKKLLPFIKIEKKYYDFNKIKTLVASGVWNTVSKISGIISTGLDLLITNLFVDATAMGNVSVSSVLHGYVLSVFAKISGVFMPQLTIDYANKNYEAIRRQLISTVRLLGFFAAIPITLIFVYSGDFYRLWVPKQNIELLRNLSVLRAAALPVSLIFEPIWNVFTVTNKVKQSALMLMVSSVISIVGTFLLLSITSDTTIKLYIIVGFSTIIGIIRCVTFLPIMGAKCVGLKWNTFYPVMFLNLICLSMVMIISAMIKKIIVINSWIMLIAVAFITAFITLIINYAILLTSDERKFIKSKIKRVIKE